MNVHGTPIRPHGLVTLLLLACAAGCDLPGKPDPADREKRPDEVRDFATLFGQHCAGCHGKEGRFGPAPPLNDPLFLAIVPEEELLMIVAGGRKGTLMPAFGGRPAHAAHQDGKAVIVGGALTAEQVKVLAKKIHSTWGKMDAPPKDAPAYKADDKAGNKEAGAKVFARACAGCHGKDGAGGEKTGAVNDPDFLALLSDQVLRRIIITGRPDLGMPNYAGTDGRGKDFRPLTSPEVADLVALLAAWREGRNP